MVSPLRKIKLDGTPYHRRPAVETEIQELKALSPLEIEGRASIGARSSPEFVSSEALVHFVRNATAEPHREKLTEQLLQRVLHLTPRVEDLGGATASLTRTNIRDDVIDHFVDLLLSDRRAYDDRLDYYEINFNSAIARDRKDASDRHWKHENRSEELSNDEEEIPHVLDAALDSYDPFDQHELDQKTYRARLDEAIDGLPELQRRIIEMLRHDIPIESKDPTVVTISKALDKSEKTIRTHRDKAFAILRMRLVGKGNLL
ncbi:hypothetical protein D3C77_286810 [compost metagenome]